MTTKRIGYIGLSSPIAFDYSNQASRTSNDTTTYSSPNPIYMGGLGMLLLYDELWFLCESLCPENMRKLDYVKFIDQEFPMLDFKEIHNQALTMYFHQPSDRCLLAEYLSYEASLKYAKAYDSLWDSIRYTRETINRDLGSNNDLGTNTHSILIQGLHLYPEPNEQSTFNYLFDTLTMEALYEKTGVHMEYLVKAPVSIFIEDIFSTKLPPTTNQTKAVELLSIKKIPNYITAKGPYHPCVDDIRSMSTLKDFRAKIASLSSLADAAQIAYRLNQEFTDLRTELFKQALSPEHPLKSLMYTVFSTAISTEIPFFSLLTDPIADIATYSKAKKRGWAKFMLDSGLTGE